MAIDDVITSYGNQVGNGSFLAMQPSGGDEWLINAIICESITNIMPDDDAGLNLAGLWGAETDFETDMQSASMHPLKLFVNNGDYLRLQNNSGATINIGYSAIKTKD